MIDWLLDWVFPKRCLGCRRWDTWLCAACCTAITKPGDVSAKGIYQIPQGIQFLYYLNKYQTTPLLQKSIQELKYGYIKEIGTLLGKQLCQQVSVEYDYVIPIPLHRRRLRERGFNQSDVIAQQLKMPVLPALQRIHYTPPQAQLNRAQRLTNVAQSFRITPKHQNQLKGARTLLVDDVYTTGTTMNTCAALLYQAGARHVDGAVLALD